MGATETRKLIHKHQTKARTYVTKGKSQDFKTKRTDQVWCCNKWIHELWSYTNFRITNVKQKKCRKNTNCALDAWVKHIASKTVNSIQVE